MSSPRSLRDPLLFEYGDEAPGVVASLRRRVGLLIARIALVGAVAVVFLLVLNRLS